MCALRVANTTHAHTPQADNQQQQPVRVQRDDALLPLRDEWLPIKDGGHDRTFAKMSSITKVNYINAMAQEPSNWHPAVAIKRAESKVSSDRSNYLKNMGKRDGGEDEETPQRKVFVSCARPTPVHILR